MQIIKSMDQLPINAVPISLPILITIPNYDGEKKREVNVIKEIKEKMQYLHLNPDILVLGENYIADIYFDGGRTGAVFPWKIQSVQAYKLREATTKIIKHSRDSLSTSYL